MKRSYNPDQKVTPLTPLPTPQKVSWKAWEDGRILHDIKEASQILTNLYGLGFAEQTLYKKCKSGAFTENLHWCKIGGLVKISIRNIVDHPPINRK